MAAWGYKLYLQVLKVSLTSERSEQVRETLALEDKIRIPIGHEMFCSLYRY